MSQRGDPVRVGLVGAGFAAHLHMGGYHRCGDVDVEVVSVASAHKQSAERFAREHGIPSATDSVDAILADDTINLVDLCVPNDQHERLAIAACQAGKHVLCEKPLTGYFGGPEAKDPVGDTPRDIMLAGAIESAQRMVRTAECRGVRLMYAENWVYSPAIVKAQRLAAASGGAILEIRGQECHSGSHAAYSRTWRRAGGGALLRLGSHPLGAALWLKSQEGLQHHGRSIRPASVLADVDNLPRGALAASGGRLVGDWHDVENWATLLLAFDDGSRATIHATDTVLGGIEDTLELMLSNCHLKCDLTHNSSLMAYAPEDGAYGNEYLMEKIHTQAGWNYVGIDEDFLMGYPQEIHDASHSIAHHHPPRSSGALGLEVVRVIYAAYLSAERGCRIELDEII